MRLRIRTLLLTVALLCSMTSTASACLPPILNPFCWLFGCSYGCGGGGYGYGYDYGYGHGYAANPYSTQRVIDDWLGYGYLRNQEGTLGHYPGRPFSTYRPWFPGLFAPCPPPAPALAMPGPMVAPMPMQMPIPTMHNPCWDPCQSQCGDPCMPAPMVQCQPAPVPVTTWRPVTVDRGNWQMVWVPRPVTTMVPQTQYITPPQMMSAPMMDAGCGDNCFGDAGGMMQGIPSESGCCGSEGMMQPQPMVPQSTMMYPGNMPMAQQYAVSPYSSMNGWNPSQGTMAWSPLGPAATGGYANSAWGNPYSAGPMRPRMFRRELRRSAMHHHHGHRGLFATPYPYPGGVAASQPMAFPGAFSQAGYPQPMYGQSLYGQQAYSQPQQLPMMASPMMASPMMASPMMASPMMSSQMVTSPMTAQSLPNVYAPGPAQMEWTMQGTRGTGMPVAGDVMGDHEFAPATTAAIPVIPNSFSGSVPMMRANLSRPVQTLSAQRYPNAVR